jgi:hypothetical protein
MNKVGQFLQTRLGALALWVVVMYVAAGLWNVIDDRAWYAFPSYVLVVLAWIGSFVYLLASFMVWRGGRIQLKASPPQPPTSQPADPDVSDD